MSQRAATPPAGPVFLDPTGRRGRRVRVTCYALGALIAPYLVLVVLSLALPAGMLHLDVPGLGPVAPDAAAPRTRVHPRPPALPGARPSAAAAGVHAVAPAAVGGARAATTVSQHVEVAPARRPAAAPIPAMTPPPPAAPTAAGPAATPAGTPATVLTARPVPHSTHARSPSPHPTGHR